MVAAALFAAYVAVRRARRSSLMSKIGKNAVYVLTDCLTFPDDRSDKACLVATNVGSQENDLS